MVRVRATQQKEIIQRPLLFSGEPGLIFTLLMVTENFEGLAPAASAQTGASDDLAAPAGAKLPFPTPCAAREAIPQLSAGRAVQRKWCPRISRAEKFVLSSAS